MHPARRVGTLLALSLLASVAAPSAAQSTDAPEWLQKLAIDPESPEARKHAAQQRKRVAAEQQLRKVRFQHFGPIKKTEIRQEGIIKLREFDDPALYSSLIRIFEREALDVKSALLDQFAASESPEGDAALAWMGVFDADEQARALAGGHLRARREKLGETPLTAKLVVFEGLKASDQRAVASAAKFASAFDIIEAIPWLISGQVGGAPRTTAAGINASEGSALAWIMVGTQTAYISDLQPVVGPSAVAFDPQLSVVNEGVILRVLDAVVVTYNVDIHNSLIDLTSRAWGQPTHQLGWNVPAWHKWYRETFVPYWNDKQRELAAAVPAQAPRK
jgi:hypothetical protein